MTSDHVTFDIEQLDFPHLLPKSNQIEDGRKQKTVRHLYIK